MDSIKVLREESDVDHRLTELGLSRDKLAQVAVQAATAIRSAVKNDPKNAAGLLGWIYGTRALRELFCPANSWEINRKNNVESILNVNTGVRVIYQNAESACGREAPQPRSAKGEGCAEMVHSQYSLDLKGGTQIPRGEFIENHAVWFLCVSEDNDKVSAELLRPLSIGDDGGFDGVVERIFVYSGDDFDIKIEDDAPMSDDEFDVVVTRK